MKETLNDYLEKKNIDSNSSSYYPFENEDKIVDIQLAFTPIKSIMNDGTIYGENSEFLTIILKAKNDIGKDGIICYWYDYIDFLKHASDKLILKVGDLVKQRGLR